MNRWLMIFGFVAAAGTGIVVGQALQAPPGIKQTLVVRTDLAEFPGKEAIVFVGEFSAGARTGRHRHPGTEFLYVLEGHGVLEQEGREPVKLEPGVGVFSEPGPDSPSFIHEAINLSASETMKTFVVLIINKGDRPGIPVDE